MIPRVVARNLGKKLRSHNAQRSLTFQDALISGWKNLGSSSHHWVLKDVSFEIGEGECLALVGKNGAGKSTLVRLLGGLLTPDEGRLTVIGRVAAVLDPMATFHEEQSGRENVQVAFAIAGLDTKTCAKQFERIVDFSELAHCIDNPVRTYSQGMQLRLALAVALHTGPEILLIDEALSFADDLFQEKCFRRIRQLKSEGCAAIIASHDLADIIPQANRALLLESGRVVAFDYSEIVRQKYSSLSTEVKSRSELIAAARKRS